MSNDAANNDAAQPQAMTVPMSVLSQYLKDFSFENPNAPGILGLMSNGAPQVNITVNLTTSQLQAPTPAAPPAYECALTLKADATLKDPLGADQPAFIVECTYAGAFAFPADLPEQLLRALLMVEAPRLLFPFARAIVADAARDGGFGPLMVNPIDFASMYERQLQYEAQAALAPQTGTA